MSFASVNERLMALVHDHGVTAELIRPGVPMPTVPLAAAAIGVAEEQIIKSLLFCAPDRTCLLAIACGTAKIDRHRLSDASGLPKLKLADPATVLAITGFAAGGVAPVGHLTRVPVFVDRRVADLPWVYGGGGTEETLLKIRPGDIIRLTNATVAEITAPT